MGQSSTAQAQKDPDIRPIQGNAVAFCWETLGIEIHVRPLPLPRHGVHRILLNMASWIADPPAAQSLFPRSVVLPSPMPVPIARLAALTSWRP